MTSRVLKRIGIALIVIAAPIVIFAVATLTYRLYRWAAELIGTGNYEYIATCGVLMLTMIIVCGVIVKCMDY